MGEGFNDLVAYQRATALADEIWAAVSRWPKFERWSVGMQLVRAADSVAANIAEAGGRWGIADRRRLAFIARGSACEVEHWLRRAAVRELPGVSGLDPRAREVSRLTNGLTKAWALALKTEV